MYGKTFGSNPFGREGLGGKTCGGCGRPNKSADNFCTFCGSEFEKRTKGEKEESGRDKVCLRCNKPNLAKSNFCLDCGFNMWPSQRPPGSEKLDKKQKPNKKEVKNKLGHAEEMRVLGVSGGFTAEDLRRAYFREMGKVHPSLNLGPKAHVKALKVKHAYKKLRMTIK